MKKAYLKKVPAKVKAKKQYHDKLEKYDLDLVKAYKLTIKAKKPIIYQTYMKKSTFNWGSRQKILFQAIKNDIINNTIIEADLNL